jgi:hypothetical protein
MRIKITMQQLDEEYAMWRVGGRAERNSDDLRFGQYMWNKYGEEGPWPKLFYTESRDEAYNLIHAEINEDVEYGDVMFDEGEDE